MKKQFFHLLFYFILGSIIYSCATPIAPTGGPRDETAPVIEFTHPKSGTTNFDGQTFEIQFNEYINRSSVNGAITIEPDLGIDYEVSWKRRRMNIKFENEFPDSTTVIVKLGGKIADVNGNRMDKTTTIAISTGDEIDSGSISGKILLATTGRGAGNQRVLLYRSPIDLTKKANYEITTDTSGTFTFSYLSEGRYQALLVDDRNRNKIWDRENESAFPFYEEFIFLEKNGIDTLRTLYTTLEDTLNPDLLGIGLLSSNRLRLRFSEGIALEEDAQIEVRDSSGNHFSAAYPLYISPEDNYVLLAQSEEALDEETTYRLDLDGITDLTGNLVEQNTLEFTGSSQEDTTQQRIISANTDQDLQQSDSFIITYAAPITQPEITDSLVVIEGTIDFQDWPAVETDRNNLIVHPQEQWVEDVEYQFLAWNPVTQRRAIYEPQIWDSTQFGDIEILITDHDSAAVYTAELSSAKGKNYFSETFSDDLLITYLPPISYTLVVFKDENENGDWDRGSVIPFQSPEPYSVQKIQVQEGFTSQVEIVFEDKFMEE